MNSALRVLLILAVVIGLMGLLFSLARRIRPDPTDSICRVRLLRLGEAVALSVEDRGGGAFPALRNPPPFTLWTPGLPQAADEVLRPYLGGLTDLPPQRQGESSAAWLERLRAGELTVCPATGFGYLAHLELLATSPSEFSRTDSADWVFRCQGSTPGRGVHRHNGVWGIHQALLGTSERSVARAELDDIRRDLIALNEASGKNPTLDQSRRLDALRQRLAALERAFADGRTSTTVRRLISDVTWANYP